MSIPSEKIDALIAKYSEDAEKMAHDALLEVLFPGHEIVSFYHSIISDLEELKNV